mmetsp:Transcript_30032/g.32718  ORF Transcript_30032/g.32718 Transcript_30032/m.32718 type:complete len:85 (+) Transcript_30032:665-919(+)
MTCLLIIDNLWSLFSHISYQCYSLSILCLFDCFNNRLFVLNQQPLLSSKSDVIRVVCIVNLILPSFYHLTSSKAKQHNNNNNNH